MSTLPAELVDSVIDLISSSPSMLAACALVCRQWVPRSRYYYFSSIKLVRDRGRDTVKPFLSLVASPLATFISSVREVQLMHKSSYGAPVLSAGDIIGLLARYGINPTSLYLKCQCTQLSMGRTRGDLFPALTHLQLTLYDAQIEDGAFEKVLNQLQTFPSLKSLALITGSKQPGRDSLDTTPNMLPPTVRQLDVMASSWILGRMLLLDPPSNISTLILRRIFVGWGEIDKYLSNSRVRATLRSLSLDGCDYSDRTAS
ncbi:hypothetical protein B0H11DRAFT_282283 [Mycena galericulata]|nr:hypothetical protein B0H11DRAFT_282283 [Mycena galericulata]